MKNSLAFLCFLFLVIRASAQSNYCIENRFSQGYYFDSAQIEFTPSLTYAVSKRWPSTTIDSLKLDVFAPKLSEDSLQKRPFILLIHGGAFLSGARTDMHYQCMQYARRGFVVATISYRLGWNCSATDLLGVCVFCQGENYKLQTATYRAAQDGRAAMRYMFAHANDFGIDTAWMFVGGESAGSITALHTAFWDQTEADTFAGWASSQVGLLDTAGNNLPSNYTIKGVIDNCGAVSRDSVVLNNGNIPVISFHDEGDCVVPNYGGQVISCACQPFYWVGGSNSIHNLLKNEGVCTEMNLIPNSINHCSYPTWNLVPRASCFLKRLMCNECKTETNTGAIGAIPCDTLKSSQPISAVVKLQPLQNFRYFPNPTMGNLTIDLTNLLSSAPLNISISNSIGEVIEQHNNISTAFFITKSSFEASGLYSITISSEGKILGSGKIISNP